MIIPKHGRSAKSILIPLFCTLQYLEIYKITLRRNNLRKEGGGGREESIQQFSSLVTK